MSPFHQSTPLSLVHRDKGAHLLQNYPVEYEMGQEQKPNVLANW